MMEQDVLSPPKATLTVTHQPDASTTDSSVSQTSGTDGLIMAYTLEPADGVQNPEMICSILPTASPGTGTTDLVITQSETAASSGDLTLLSASALARQMRDLASAVGEPAAVTMGDDLGGGGSGGGGASKWWSAEATLKLIKLYREHRHWFSDSQFKKKTVWELIAAQLAKEPELKDKVHYTATQVSNRWKNLTKMYRDSVSASLRLGNSAKCPFFDEIAAVYSYTPQEQCIGHVEAKIPIAVASSTKPASGGTLRYVPIAPKRSGDGFSAGACEVSDPKQRRIEPLPSQPSSATFIDVVNAVSQLNEEKKRQDKVTLEKLENMHRERMDMFRQFLEILKQYKK